MAISARRWLLAGVCAVLTSAGTARAEWGVDASLGLNYDDNLSNSLESEDRKGDGSITASLAAGHTSRLGTDTGVAMSVFFEPSVYLRYSDLTNYGLGARAQVRHKFGLGGAAPWIALSAQAAHRDYGYDYRDGWQYDGGVSAGQQLGERWSVNASIRYDGYVADRTQPTIRPGISTAAYDVFGWTFGAQAGLLVSEADLVSVGYAWRNGTVTAITPPDYEVLEYSSAIARDPVFGSDNPLIAYRVKAKTDMWSLNWNHVLGRHAAVNLAYSYRRSDTESELGYYYSNVIGVSVVYAW